HAADGIAIRAGGHLAQPVVVHRRGPHLAAAASQEGGAVVAALFAVGTARAEAGSTDVDDFRIDLPDIVEIDAQPAARPGAGVGQEYVAGADQLVQDLKRRRLFQRQPDAAL